MILNDDYGAEHSLGLAVQIAHRFTELKIPHRFFTAERARAFNMGWILRVDDIDGEQLHIRLIHPTNPNCPNL